jgi:hypothetical protein
LQFNLGWKLALVTKGLAAPGLLNTYTEERQPVIAEMLRRTNAIFDATTKGDTGERAALGRASEASTGAHRRGRELYMLGVNYGWSSIVLDDSRTKANAVEGAAGAYGTAGGTTAAALRAGDRAPDAPALHVLASSGWFAPQRTIALFDTFRPLFHTVLIFVGEGTEVDEVRAMLRLMRRQPPGLVRSVIIVPMDMEKRSTRADLVMVDVHGHAFRHYGVDTESAAVTAVVVRPDAMVGAIVHGAEGLEKYFGLIFVTA